MESRCEITRGDTTLKPQRNSPMCGGGRGRLGHFFRRIDRTSMPEWRGPAFASDIDETGLTVKSPILTSKIARFCVRKRQGPQGVVDLAMDTFPRNTGGEDTCDIFWSDGNAPGCPRDGGEVDSRATRVGTFSDRSAWEVAKKKMISLSHGRYRGHRPPHLRRGHCKRHRLPMYAKPITELRRSTNYAICVSHRATRRRIRSRRLRRGC